MVNSNPEPQFVCVSVILKKESRQLHNYLAAKTSTIFWTAANNLVWQYHYHYHIQVL